MHPYIPLVAAATLISAACGGAVFLHHRNHRGSQLAGLVLFGCGFWSLCQLLACLSPDPARAELWFRVSAFGWLYIGPLSLHVFMEATGDERRPIRVARNALYAIGSTLLVATLFSDLILAGAIPVEWGYLFVTGPLYPLSHLNATAGVALGGVTRSGVVRQQQGAALDHRLQVLEGPRRRQHAVLAGTRRDVSRGRLLLRALRGEDHR